MGEKRSASAAGVGAMFVLLLGVPIPPGSSRALDCASPVIETKRGPVCGKPVPGGPPGAAPRRLHAYLGIPYAAPPVGRRRWAAPEDPTRWATTRDATRLGPSCPQSLPPGVEVPTSEDCLTLNVWTPDPGGGSLPVLVFLYGGSFVHGGTAAPLYDGVNLAGAGPLVVVTLNYRIGALGFLAGLEPFAGNYGILDQQQALGWVRDNVARFGGDPARVTLFGESAGAMSVGIHLGAASSRDLFRAAILESDPYGIPYKTPKQARGYADALVRHLGCEPPADAPSCLRGKAVDDILAAQEKLPVTETFLLGLASFVPWGPVVGTPPLDRQPNELRIDKPVILGTNENEGTLFVAMQEKSIGPIGEVKYVLETDIAFGDRGSAVRSRYASLGEKSPVAALAQIVTDDLFVCANRYVLERAEAAAWAYRFTHVPSFPIWPRIPSCAPAARQVCHAAELPFVFGNPFAAELGAEEASFTEDEKRLARTMMRLWTGFARDVEPPKTDPAWAPFRPDAPFGLRIDEPPGEAHDREAPCRFWNALGYDRTGPLGGLF